MPRYGPDMGAGTGDRDPRPGDPRLSVVVVAFDMARELPRTLRSLAPGHQRGVVGADLELIVVDNGSPHPVDPSIGDDVGCEVRVLRVDDAAPSPVLAANLGLAAATGGLVGLFLDGARLASPGLLAGARIAARLADQPVITAPAFHLGAVTHMRAPDVGYDQAAEDELLAGCGWEEDGYRLFGVSTLAGSSGRGLFGPMGESNSLFLRPVDWETLGGLDERFALPGGGLANHDLYRRACSLDGAELVVLLGEGTFHQFHGGAATSRRTTWDLMHDDYQAIRGVAYQPPSNNALFLGRVPRALLAHLDRSVRWAIDDAAKREGASAGQRDTAPPHRSGPASS